jgi:hypothetical protein
MVDEKIKPKAGSIIPWEIKEKTEKKIMGDREIIKKEWEEIEELAYRYVWAVLTDF